MQSATQLLHQKHNISLCKSRFNYQSHLHRHRCGASRSHTIQPSHQITQDATQLFSQRLQPPDVPDLHVNVNRREALAVAAALASTVSWSSVNPAAAQDTPDPTITHRVFIDVGIASSAFKPAGERTLGDKTVLPKDAEPAGRIVIGLFGNVAPVTVGNLVAAVQAGAFTGSAFSKISPGEFIQLGKQGNRRLGDVEPPAGVLQVNTDLASPAPFKLTHSRPGTVSLSLSENDEDPKTKERSDYRALEFLITTGPGPVPRLDGLNPVFGRVESGMDVVARLAQVPSFQPDVRSQQLNRFAAFIGDERADNVRRQYGKPLRAIIVMDSGVLPAAQQIQQHSSKGPWP